MNSNKKVRSKTVASAVSKHPRIKSVRANSRWLISEVERLYKMVASEARSQQIKRGLARKSAHAPSKKAR